MQSRLRLSTTALMRVQLGLTQQQLANSLGISRSTLALAETGRRPMPVSAEPFLRNMFPIAAAMPLPVTYRSRRKDCGRTNNRVASPAQSYLFLKKRFVTAQSSASTRSTQQAMTRYSAGIHPLNTFSTQLLQEYTDCQKILEQSTIKKARLQGQLAYLQLEARAAVIRGKELQAQLDHLNTMLQLNQELIEKFPLTPTKRKLEHRNAKLHCKRLVLEDRLEHFNAIAMVLREYNINVMVQQLALLEQLVTAVEKRKGELNQTEIMDSVLPGLIMACSDNYITTRGTVSLAVTCQAA